jgi:hypothetical protein
MLSIVTRVQVERTAMFWIEAARPQEPLNELVFDTSQPQLPLADATPEDMTMAATMAAQRMATRSFLIDIGVMLLA